MFHKASKYVKLFGVAVYGQQSEKNWNYCFELVLWADVIFSIRLPKMVFVLSGFERFWVFDASEIRFFSLYCEQLLF